MELRGIPEEGTGDGPVPEPISFESFFEEHRSKVFGAMCLVTGNRQEAEEITQDAFLRLLGGGSLGLADRRDDLAAVEDRDEVVRVMRRLTAHQRAALVLTGYLGYSSEEAAQVLGVRASTVRALATKGRATARAMVEERQ